MSDKPKLHPRYCTKCKKGIWGGYQIETFEGFDYFCSDACAFNESYTEEQYLKDHKENEYTCWTEWELDE